MTDSEYSRYDELQDKFGPFCFECHWRGEAEDFDEDGLCPDCRNSRT